MTKTPAVVFTDVAQATLQDIDMPEPGPGEVQVRTLYSIVSAGTEGWAFRNLFTWQPTQYPCVPGYQRMGVIAKLGEGVTGWQVGDRIMATVGRWEGPVRPFWGSHVALANTVATELYHIPEGADDLDASGAVVAQVGYNAAYRADYGPGDWVVVYGDGLIGQSGSQAARSRGAQVILVGHRPERLALAAQYSADVVIDNHTEDVVQAVMRHTGGKPAPVVIDTVQSEASQVEYVPLLEYGRGQIVYSGFTPAATWADMGLLQKRELTAHFVAGWTRPRMDATLRLMAEGQMRLRPLITHFVPCTRAADMYRMIVEKSEPFTGIAFDWQ
jgi:2-desacetyl-2-hydroxyethyl bacteriochlorophyllide A dehydrogenase